MLVFLFFILATLILDLKAQSNFEHDVCLKSVSFSGDVSNIDIPIKRDINGVEFPKPQYSKVSCEGTGKVRKAPVAYVSGSKLKVKVVAEKNCPEQILIRGMGPDLKFPSSNTTVELFTCQVAGLSDDGDNWLYEGTSDMAFESGRIRYFENFQIDWQWSYIDEDATDQCDPAKWISFGTSSNPLYVTLRKFDPSTTQFAPTFFHTLLQFTSQSASNESTDAGAISKIWSAIKNLTISGADSGESLTYYNEWLTGCLNTAQLLLNGDGQCGSFADFYLDALKVQGIRHQTENNEFVGVFPKSNIYDIETIFVDKWSFSTGIYSNNGYGFDYGVSQNLNFVGIPSQDPYLSGSNLVAKFTNGNQYNWVYSDITDLEGIDGQGVTTNPKSIFNNHQFVRINNTLMDPSYGVSYSSIQDVENSLSAYGCLKLKWVNENDFDFDQDGIPDDLNGDGMISSSILLWIYFMTNDMGLVELNSN